MTFRPQAMHLSICVVVVCFLLLRVNVYPFEISPDEFIAEAVIRGMHLHHNLDGNWINADDIPPVFRYDQFNFYSYHLVSYFILKICGFRHVITTLRLESVGLQAVAIVAVASAMARKGCHGWQVLVTAALLSISPALVQDAHIARAESLLYCLLAVALWCTTLKSRTLACIGVGLVVGFGCASKVTFVSAGLVLLPKIVTAFRERVSSGLLLLVLGCGLALVGFVAGAPYVPYHMTAYLNGLDVLQQQYTLGQPPHSPPNFTILSQFEMMMRFTAILYGPLVVVVVPLLFRRELDWLAGVAMMTVVIIGYFACKPVFFERNIGLALMALIIIGGAVTTSYRSLVPSVMTGLVMGWWSIQIAVANTHLNERRLDWETAHVGKVSVNWPNDDVVGALRTCEGVYGVADYGDAYSIEMRREAEAAGFVPFAHYDSVFHIVPTSTLQTYLDPDVDYYNCLRPVIPVRRDETGR